MIANDLFAIMEQSAPDEPIPVSVWIQEQDIDRIEQTVLEETGLNKAKIAKLDAEDIELSQDAVDTYIMAERTLYASMQTEASQAFLNRIGKIPELSAISEERVIFISKYAPMLLLELTTSEILALASDDEVVEILYAPQEELNDETEEIVDEVAISSEQNSTEAAFEAIRVPQAQAMGYTGEGIKIGQVETGIADTSYFPNASITIHPDDIASIRTHATAVLSFMYDIAPDAEYYCTTYNNTLEIGIEWLITQGVNIINNSRGDSGGIYEAQCKWIDHLAINHSVHYVKSAGNINDQNPNGIVSRPGMSYNAIVAGAANSSLTTRWSGSCYADLATTVDPWAYKPDIVAPGQRLYIRTENGALSSGTSFSAPIVTGIAALMMQSRSALKTRQDALKACILSSINNSTLRYVPGTTGYNECGAGLIDAYSAVCTAKYGRYSRDLYFNVGAEIDSTIEVEFSVTSSDDLKRISLTWLMNSRASGTHGVNSATVGNYVDLKLEILDENGNIVGTSDVLRGNVEIVQLVPETYGTYTARIILKNVPERKVYFSVSWW